MNKLRTNVNNEVNRTSRKFLLVYLTETGKNTNATSDEVASFGCKPLPEGDEPSPDEVVV